MRPIHQNILILLVCFACFQLCYCTNPTVKRHPRSLVTEEKSPIPKGCECKSEQTGELHNFCYVDPQNEKSFGKKFDCSSLEHLESVGIFNFSQEFVDTSKPDRVQEDAIIVTACSDKEFEPHYQRCSPTLATLSQYYPKQKYILYDLGMNSTNRENAEKIDNLKIRNLDVSNIQKNFTEIYDYKWKVLMIAEVLKEYSNVWWITANTIVVEQNFMEIVYRERADNKVQSDIVMMDYSSHSNFATLDPSVLTYIPTNSVDLLKSQEFGLQFGTDIVYFARTRKTLKILKWALLCALDDNCMNPPTADSSCEFGANRFDYFANCFRFDQSIINLLLLNKFQDYHKYTTRDYLTIQQLNLE